MHLDGQHTGTTGNDLGLLGIDMHFTLRTTHLVDTGLVVWACAEMRPAVRPRAEIVKYRRFPCASFDPIRVKTAHPPPLKRVMFADRTSQLIFAFTHIPRH